MKRNKACLLLLCLLISTQLSAQKFPGYRGKYFMLGYSANIGYNIAGISNGDYLNVHYRHGLHAEMLINRFTSLGLEVDYLKFNEGEVLIERENADDEYFDRDFISMSGGAYVKQYFGRNYGLIAPLGSFAKMKIFAEKMHFNDISANSSFKSNSYWSPGVAISYGQSRVIAKSIRLEGSVDFNILGGFFLPVVDIFARKNVFYTQNYMAYHHFVGYSSTARLSVSGLLF